MMTIVLWRGERIWSKTRHWSAPRQTSPHPRPSQREANCQIVTLGLGPSIDASWRGQKPPTAVGGSETLVFIRESTANTGETLVDRQGNPLIASTLIDVSAPPKKRF